MSTGTFADWKTRHPSSGGRYVGGNRSTPSRVQQDASDAQVRFIKNLAAERDYLSLAPRDRELVESACTGKPIGKYDASKLIDVLKVTVRADASSFRPAFLGAASAAQVQPKADRKVAEGLLADALYLVGEKKVAKVQASRTNAGCLYAKVCDLTDGSWTYAPGVIFEIKPEQQLTLAQARELGRVTDRCVRCGAELTKSELIGPVCAKKTVWRAA